MSKQLALSAAFSVFAMAAFVVLGTPDRRAGDFAAHMETGAPAQPDTPAPSWQARLPAGLSEF